MSTVAFPVQTTSIVDLLKNPSAYPDTPRSVQVIETRISWVFLTDRHAYKLKKPVRFEFLDFSTAERRHRACQDEIRLNRRLAPGVYEDVLPVTRDPSGLLELNGEGEEVDWVVKMRRLPAQSALDVLVREKRLGPKDAETIAQHPIDFYAGRLPKPLDSGRYRRVLERHVRANGIALLQSLSEERPRLRRIQGAQLRYLHVQAELLDDRAAAGRIVEGHGDLRPEHIYLDPGPIVIDCVEFSDELRTVDIADELSFLAMECRRLGDDHVGETVLARYRQACGDEVPESLLAFYGSYRALVRAKIALLRDQQLAAAASRPSTPLIRKYLDLADKYVESLGPPVLLIVGGLMGTGKSSLAVTLSETLGCESLSTDLVRHTMLRRSLTPACSGEGYFQPDMRTRVYDELFHQANVRLQNRQSVILDGTFLTDALRTRAYELAYRHGAVSLHVHCTCPRQTAYARIQQRADTGQSESAARTELYDLQARNYQPTLADDPSITVDTTQPMSQQQRIVCAELRHLLFE